MSLQPCSAAMAKWQKAVKSVYRALARTTVHTEAPLLPLIRNRYFNSKMNFLQRPKSHQERHINEIIVVETVLRTTFEGLRDRSELSILRKLITGELPWNIHGTDVKFTPKQALLSLNMLHAEINQVGKLSRQFKEPMTKLTILQNLTKPKPKPKLTRKPSLDSARPNDSWHLRNVSVLYRKNPLPYRMTTSAREGKMLPVMRRGYARDHVSRKLAPYARLLNLKPEQELKKLLKRYLEKQKHNVSDETKTQNRESVIRKVRYIMEARQTLLLLTRVLTHRQQRLNAVETRRAKEQLRRRKREA